MPALCDSLGNPTRTILLCDRSTVSVQPTISWRRCAGVRRKRHSELGHLIRSKARGEWRRCLLTQLRRNDVRKGQTDEKEDEVDHNLRERLDNACQHISSVSRARAHAHAQWQQTELLCDCNDWTRTKLP